RIVVPVMAAARMLAQASKGHGACLPARRPEPARPESRLIQRAHGELAFRAESGNGTPAHLRWADAAQRCSGPTRERHGPGVAQQAKSASWVAGPRGQEERRGATDFRRFPKARASAQDGATRTSRGAAAA